MKPVSLLVPLLVDIATCAAAHIPNIEHDTPANVPHARQEATQTNPGTILSPVPSMPGLCLFPCPPAGTCACTYHLPEQRCTETGCEIVGPEYLRT
ncbi:uncharacterized protein TrAFT101_010782 [Trichoderma asperellum]|uniref:Long chronological lifespan protein 2 n=1 Tax=Trichoderma asperellum (strain ATCC 204424 / CBS 433.97 / NBRC 101777) TaxID=1042311 RepID=A0A2T3YWX1_TRIA4|nr:hypothetical protein M441DRAFT_83007 [Trichoderma asperellum CBS 433.97]PTB37046.1 hypothetical protein M441DRAFT_83007 [Trichoderma asperellum CBS 433.97]UKZ95976.1 hypothetical protein TrAFT101_010782 [Trichoderma asperellum]